MMKNDAIKVFISYSWTSREHEQVVLDLATELRESGVDAILDKWDLKEGADADKFMESMVTDSTITKVLIVCDKKYADKSDKREGGAGTEAQIISRRVYEQVGDANKFVAAAFELNEETGKPYLPVYYGSRIYFDFTDSDKYTQKFEELLRWIYNKPLYTKPKLGKTPTYIVADDRKTLQTTAQYKRVLNLLSEGKPNANGALRDYLTSFSTNLTVFQINDWKDKEFDDVVLESIHEFLPYRNEWIEVLDSVCKNNSSEQNLNLYYPFFETVYKIIVERREVTHPYDCDEDNMKFILQELFLYFVALLLKYELFEYVSETLTRTYYNENAIDEYKSRYDYCAFNSYIKSIEYRNNRLNLNKLSLHSDIMNNRAQNMSIISAKQLQQADFILLLYNIIHPDTHNWANPWIPKILLYHLISRVATFELFVRAESTRFFNRLKIVLGIDSKLELEERITAIDENKIYLPRWHYYGYSKNTLMSTCNLPKLATKP